MYYYFFFFKQKTAYEFRISDWSSDVCSSVLNNGLSSIKRQQHGASHADDTGKRHPIARNRIIASALHHADAVHRHICRSRCLDSRRGGACSHRHRLAVEPKPGGYDQHELKSSSHVTLFCLSPTCVKLGSTKIG